MTENVHWATSSFCATQACVQVAHVGGGDVLVRDSKYPGQAPLRFTAEEWAAFLRGVQSGEFTR